MVSKKESLELLCSKHASELLESTNAIKNVVLDSRVTDAPAEQTLKRFLKLFDERDRLYSRQCHELKELHVALLKETSKSYRDDIEALTKVLDERIHYAKKRG
jgi:hypothetical protein